jgi:hypothetical protein
LTENLLAQPLRPKLNALKSSGIFVSWVNFFEFQFSNSSL